MRQFNKELILQVLFCFSAVLNVHGSYNSPDFHGQPSEILINAAKHQSSACGGAIEGSPGLINYKLGQPLVAEWCTWLIQADGFESVNFTLLTNGFDNGENTPIGLYTIDTYNSLLQLETYLGPSRPLTAETNGPVVIVLLQHRSYYNSSGFSLLFQGHGRKDSFDAYYVEHNNLELNKTGEIRFHHNKTQEFPLYALMLQPPYKDINDDNRSSFQMNLDGFMVNERYSYRSEVFINELLFTSVGIRPKYRARYGCSDPGPFTTEIRYPALVVFKSQSSVNDATFNITWKPFESWCHLKVNDSLV